MSHQLQLAATNSDKTVETVLTDLQLPPIAVITIISTVLSLSPTYQRWKRSLMCRQIFKTTLSERRGQGKHFCDAVCISIPDNEEICALFWFVSTSFVRGCSYNALSVANPA